MIVHGEQGDEQTYHVAVVNWVLGLVGLCAVAGTGAVVYVGAALVIAGPTARDFIRLLRRALERGG
jgi:hypothetical protein